MAKIQKFPLAVESSTTIQKQRRKKKKQLHSLRWRPPIFWVPFQNGKGRLIRGRCLSRIQEFPNRSHRRKEQLIPRLVFSIFREDTRVECFLEACQIKRPAERRRWRRSLKECLSAEAKNQDLDYERIQKTDGPIQRRCRWQRSAKPNCSSGHIFSWVISAKATNPNSSNAHSSRINGMGGGPACLYWGGRAGGRGTLLFHFYS